MEKITDSSRGEKRKRDGKDQAEEPSWAQSKFSEADLQDLVKQCILQPKDVIHWRNASGEFFPSVKNSEIVSIFFFCRVWSGSPSERFSSRPSLLLWNSEPSSES